jgi:hypothetical protein
MAVFIFAACAENAEQRHGLPVSISFTTIRRKATATIRSGQPEGNYVS